MFGPGVRAHYRASQLAAPAMIAAGRVLRHTGKVLVAAQLARDYGFTDVDGKSPRPLTLADV